MGKGIFIFVILTIFVGAIVTNYLVSWNQSRDIQIVEKAVVYTHFELWGKNEQNSNEDIFKYIVYNFGEVKAEGIVIQCLTFDANQNILRKVTRDFEDLEPGKFDYGEMYILNAQNEDIYGFCITKSCDNCEILDQKIDEYKKYV